MRSFNGEHFAISAAARASACFTVAKPDREGRNLEHFRMLISLRDESLEAEDFVGSEDEAREWFSEHWLALHNGHNFRTNPVRMELIRVESDVEIAFVSSYELSG